MGQNPMFNGFNSGNSFGSKSALELAKQGSEANGQLNPKRFSIFVKNVPAE